MNLEYTTISTYFESRSKIIGKIATYDEIIEGMEVAIMKSAESSLYLQTELDDGQMKLRVQYRNMEQMISAMEGLIRLRNYYINKANGRVTRLVGGKL